MLRWLLQWSGSGHSFQGCFRLPAVSRATRVNAKLRKRGIVADPLSRCLQGSSSQNLANFPHSCNVQCSVRYSTIPERFKAISSYWILVGVGLALCVSIYGFWGGKEEEDDDDGNKVSPSIKRQLLKADRALMNSNYHQAEKVCHKAMALVMDSKHAEKRAYLEARAFIMDKLANIYLEQKKWTEGEMLFKETLRIMLNLGVSQDDPAVIEISLKLAKVYHNQQRYSEAETGFEWCVDKARGKWEEDKSKERYALLGMCLQSRGHFHQMLRQHNRAIQDFTEILDIAEVVHGVNHIQVAVSYNNLATAVDAAKEYKRAVSLVEKSLSLVDHLQTQPQDKGEEQDEARMEYYRAIFLTNLGTIHMNNGESSLALSAYDKAVLSARTSGDEQLLNQIHHGQQRVQRSLEDQTKDAQSS